MAYKTARGDWRGSVMVAGRRTTTVFAGRRAAEAWEAQQRDLAERAGAGTLGDVTTLRAVLERYILDVAPTHKGHAWEVKRLRMWLRGAVLPLDQPIARLTSLQLTAWVVDRGRTVEAGSVLRDCSLMASVLAWARRDWQLMTHNPLTDVRKPKEPRHRERVISWSEQRQMLRQMGHRPGAPPQTVTAVVAQAFGFALRTGMRASEIAGLSWADVGPRTVTLRDTKNGDARTVPLSASAVRQLRRLRGLARPFDVSAGVLSALFARQRDRAGLAGFTFHDSRHTAATRIGRTVGQPGRLTVLEMCKVFGWRDPKRALVYVNPSADEMAGRMG